MKNIFKIFLVGLVATMLWSCEKDEDLAVANVVTTSKLTASKSTIVLLQNQDDNEAVTFDFTNSTFSIPVYPTYELQFAPSGGKYTKEGTVVITGNKKVFTVKELNTLLSGLDVKKDTPIKFDVRLNAKLGQMNTYSDVQTLTITLYTPNPDNVFPKIYVPGNYGAASGYSDWSEKNWGSPNLFAPKKDDVYYGFIYMNNATPEFKFTYAEQGWGNNKGDTAKPNTFATLKDGGENILPTTGAGTYYIKVNWAGNTYSINKMDMGIIGDATPQGWGSDVKLDFNKTTHKFETTMVLQGGKVFKFRANSSWDVKIQPTGKTDQELAPGTEYITYVSSEGTVSDDASYKVAATGTYKIELDLHNSANYNIKVTKL